MSSNVEGTRLDKLFQWSRGSLTSDLSGERGLPGGNLPTPSPLGSCPRAKPFLSSYGMGHEISNAFGSGRTAKSGAQLSCAKEAQRLPLPNPSKPPIPASAYSIGAMKGKVD